MEMREELYGVMCEMGITQEADCKGIGSKKEE